jgi:hypothetical protein
MRVVIGSFALRKRSLAIYKVFREKWELLLRGHSYRFFPSIQFA